MLRNVCLNNYDSSVVFHFINKPQFIHYPLGVVNFFLFFFFSINISAAMNIPEQASLLT